MMCQIMAIVHTQLMVTPSQLAGCEQQQSPNGNGFQFFWELTLLPEWQREKKETD
jgi:hypothetical protein